MDRASRLFRRSRDELGREKVRRHLMRARNRPGFGWKRWSTVGLHETLGLFHDCQYGGRT
jgi:hypothetical protein